MARILLQLPRCVETNDYYQWETPVILAIKVGGPIFCFYEPWILTWVKKGEGIKNELFDSLAWVYSWCSSKTKTRLAIRYKILFPVSLSQRGGRGGSLWYCVVQDLSISVRVTIRQVLTWWITLTWPALSQILPMTPLIRPTLILDKITTFFLLLNPLKSFTVIADYYVFFYQIGELASLQSIPFNYCIVTR